jgi:hypothetical protein
MKSASFNWFMKACLQASNVGAKKSLSFGGAARCRIRRIGVAIEVEGVGVERIEVLIV